VFTGLIKGLGRVVEKKSDVRSGFLKISADLAADLHLGDSIAVNGVCLTVDRLGNDWFGAAVMPVTMRGTNLALLRYGDLVNLEPALALGDRLGGHLVSGHVDGAGKIRSIHTDRNAVLIQIMVSPAIAGLIVLKGSVAVNGVSLTVQRLFPEGFEISLIPHTLKQTAFCQSKPGDLVNLETDRTMRLTDREVSAAAQPGITEQFLAEHGFT
jgi:riboflavin synthase